MSIVKTFYNITNPSGQSVDLIDVFQPINTATPGPVTGYTVNVNGSQTDLCQLFAPNQGPTISYNTGLQVNGTDLRYLFAPALPTKFTTSGMVTSSDSYTFVTFTNPNANNYIYFTTFNNVNINFLIVGGGGSGGAGGGSLNRSTQLTCGGGGQGADVVNSNTIFASFVNINVTVGAGGQCLVIGENNFKPNNGASSSITQNNITFTAVGGNCGANADFSNQSTSTPGGTSSPLKAGGSGGNGRNRQLFVNTPSGLIQGYNYDGSDASNYNTIYQNFTIDGVNLGTFSGSGSGGGPRRSGLPSYYKAQGSGGIGGYLDLQGNTIFPTNGTNGGGGGGAYTSSTTGNALNQAGGSGGNGVVILWFANNIV